MFKQSVFFVKRKMFWLMKTIRSSKFLTVVKQISALGFRYFLNTNIKKNFFRNWNLHLAVCFAYNTISKLAASKHILRNMLPFHSLWTLSLSNVLVVLLIVFEWLKKAFIPKKSILCNFSWLFLKQKCFGYFAQYLG